MKKMANNIVYGPVPSRRLGQWQDNKLIASGSSLGINLSRCPVCSFDCVYCSCGTTSNVQDPRNPDKSDFFSLEEIIPALKDGLELHRQKGTPIDYLSFVGWTEPTLHPDFAEIADAFFGIKQEYFPDTPTAIFTNSTTLYNTEVRSAITRNFDRTFFKLDAATEEVFRKINNPQTGIKLSEIITNLAEFSKDTDKVELSAMVLELNYKDVASEQYVQIIKEIGPKGNMIYLCTPDWLRPTKKSGISLMPTAEILRYVKIFIQRYGHEAIILPEKRAGVHPLYRQLMRCEK